MGLPGKLWAAPWTLVGLALGALVVILGGRAGRGRNAIEFEDNPFVPLIGASAVTLGNTIHYAPGRHAGQRVLRYDGRAYVNLGEHERAHTRQYERWGPLFLIVYGWCWLPWVAPARGNRFERAADDAAEAAADAADEAVGDAAAGMAPAPDR